MNRGNDHIRSWLDEDPNLRRALVLVGSSQIDAYQAAVSALEAHRVATIRAANIDMGHKLVQRTLSRGLDFLIVKGLPRSIEGLATAKKLITERTIAVALQSGATAAVRSPRIVFCTPHKRAGAYAPDSRRFCVVHI